MQAVGECFSVMRIEVGKTTTNNAAADLYIHSPGGKLRDDSTMEFIIQ